MSLTDVWCLSAYIQTSRALMVLACLLGLPAMLLILMSMPCVRLPNDSSAIKKCRAKVGGVLVCIMAVFGIIATIWFPIGAHQEEHLMSFGFSLYAGWIGAGLCALGGFVILCCQVGSVGIPSRENSFFYSRRGNTTTALDRPSNHAKSERV
ncbi:claudin-11 [Austrofundulus limnaeus]|uniref:Claudin-11 n=1 Tax=Austrofundulus limnaeus TaxID=52670 RepID=A0A2I4D077_AUSLI|nr:PREDICTED: claudin-11-like [Austrofundulus limnaeus]